MIIIVIQYVVGDVEDQMVSVFPLRLVNVGVGSVGLGVRLWDVQRVDGEKDVRRIVVVRMEVIVILYLGYVAVLLGSEVHSVRIGVPVVHLVLDVQVVVPVVMVLHVIILLGIVFLVNQDYLESPVAPPVPVTLLELTSALLWMVNVTAILTGLVPTVDWNVHLDISIKPA